MKYPCAQAQKHKVKKVTALSTCAQAQLRSLALRRKTSRTIRAAAYTKKQVLKSRPPKHLGDRDGLVS